MSLCTNWAIFIEENSFLPVEIDDNATGNLSPTQSFHGIRQSVDGVDFTDLPKHT